MAHLRMSKHVNAPPEVVFATATDLARLPAIIRGIKKIEVLTPGPIGLETRFRETREMFGREATEEMEITAFFPPQRYTLRCESCGAVILSVHHFVPDIAGTLVELTIRTEPLTFKAKLMVPLGWLMMGSMKKLIDADLNDLKAAAEKRAPVDSRADPKRPRRGYETSN